MVKIRDVYKSQEMDKSVIDLCTSPEIVDLVDDRMVQSIFALSDDDLSLPDPLIEPPESPESPKIDHEQETQPDAVPNSPFSSPLMICEKRVLRMAITPERSGEHNEVAVASPPPQPKLVPQKKRPRFAKTSITAAARSKSVKKRTDRSDTAKDMIVHFYGEAPFLAETIDRLKEVPVHEVKQFEQLEEGIMVVKLSRIVSDTFDESEDMFVPTESHEVKEETSIIVINNDSFLEVLLDENQHKPYFDNLASLANTPKIIYIVHGLQAILRRHQNKYNRVVQRRARAYMEGSQSSDLSPVTKSRVDTEAVSAGQTRLQVQSGLHILYPSSTSRAADWIVDLIQDLSLARYKSRYSDHPSVKSGNTVQECTAEALIRLARVTPSIAYRIQEVYPNMGTLLHALCTTGPSCMVTAGIVGAALAGSIHRALCGTAHSP